MRRVYGWSVIAACLVFVAVFLTALVASTVTRT
jgi:hypothetical protein